MQGRTESFTGLPSQNDSFGIGVNDMEERTNGNEPSGSRMVTQDSVPLNGANANPEGNGFKCTYCEIRPFTTSRGLGQHIRLKHPEESNRRINVERIKYRWSEEEELMMASEEAKALRDGGVRFMNQHLVSKFPNRTLEAIKAKRKYDAYKERVQDASTQLREEGNRVQVSVEDQSVEYNIEIEPEEALGQVASATVVDAGPDAFVQAIEAQIKVLVEELRNNSLPSTQHLVSLAHKVLNGDPLENNCLTNWLKSMFKHAKPPKGLCYRAQSPLQASSKKRYRRQEYAKLQKLYQKDFKSAARRVLEKDNEDISMPPKEEVIAFWKHIFEDKNEVENEGPSPVYSESDGLIGLWAPISVDDIRKNEQDLDSAAGPDGITVLNWRNTSASCRALFYNLILIKGTLDKEMKRARTILIPKGTGIISPANTRPISITSVTVRQLHKILANRFKTLHKFNPCQRAFIDCDGTLENISIVSTILADARACRRQLHIATLDLRKAFDSVTHKTVVDSITALGCPKQFISYISALYLESKTTLQYQGSETILSVNQGVLQGDPISPLLFNAVMDRAIEQIPKEVGYKINGITYRCVAYADDVILIASTKQGLEASIDAMTSRLASFGLKVNAEKSSTLSIVPSGREKKVKVIEESLFAIDGVPLRAIGVVETWKYLGINFLGSELGKKDFNLENDLIKVSQAPLKPYQRLRLLHSVVVPKHMHYLVLGRVSSSALKHLDLLVRKYVKNWLYFPKDVPVAYMYASVKDGGLGIFNFEQQVPLIKKTRLQRFLGNVVSDTAKTLRRSHFIKRQLEWCDKLLSGIGDNVTKSSRQQYWRNVLLNMVDTNDLRDAIHDRASTTWVYDRAKDISACDYIHYHHVRAGCLPSKARTSRGQENDRSCRAGCMGSETNYHIIQQCQRTHGGRVLRHDRVVDLIYDHMRRRSGVEVIKEPHFRTQIGLRKPDLLITQQNKTIVLDVQVVSGRNMEADHATKRSKYRDILGFEELVKTRCASGTVEFQACTISFKGLIEKKSSKLLQTLKISEHFRFMMVTSVLRGAWLNWNTFNRLTTRTR